jgi:murein DD-endopeptidase MepM/ murein hydrolase activator NlpD
MPLSIDFSKFKFSPVIDFPKTYEIYDFSQSYDPERMRAGEFGIGRYGEKRPGMYSTDLFKTGLFKAGAAPRDIHVGIDLAAPVDAPVYAFYDGRVYLTGVNPAAGDYGGTVITEHDLDGRAIWALYGHLSHRSVSSRKAGDRLRRGDIVGWLGNKQENGGWNPHLHFQLSWDKPERCDLPGAVNERDLSEALRIYPDPRLVLGPIY